MSTYDPSLDKLVKEERLPLTEDTFLYLRLYQYNGGQVKLQIGPRTYRNKEGESMPGKVGRLSRDEVAWLIEELPNLLDIMDEE
jgi:hypothetical protein